MSLVFRTEFIASTNFAAEEAAHYPPTCAFDIHARIFCKSLQCLVYLAVFYYYDKQLNAVPAHSYYGKKVG